MHNTTLPVPTSAAPGVGILVILSEVSFFCLSFFIADLIIIIIPVFHHQLQQLQPQPTMYNNA